MIAEPLSGQPPRGRRRSVLDRRLVLVVWPLLAVVVLLVAIDMARADILSSVRAYVSGESLWSKAQKDAVHHLVRFSESRDASDLRAFDEAIRIPLGDRLARTELQKVAPDLDAVRRGFGDGGNDADDITGMIRLFRLFSRFGPMQDIVAVWTAGDAQIDVLVEEAADLADAVARAPRDESRITAILGRIRATNLALTPIERRFSSAFGAASRLIQQLTNALLLVSALVLVVVGILLTRRMLRRGDAMHAALRRSHRRYARAVATEADAQHALRSMQELLTAAPAAFVAWNTRRGVLLWSDVAERLFGLARADVLGKPPPWALAQIIRAARELPVDPHNTTSVVGLSIELVDAQGNATPSSTSLSRLPSHIAGADTFAAVIEELTPARLRELRRIESMQVRSDARIRHVHERVGNQLLGFAALLRHGARSDGAPVPPDAMVAHLLAMASLHELKSTHVAAALDLQALVERCLARSSMLHGSALVVSRRHASLEGLVVGDEQALPVALVLDEILGNALRHRADPQANEAVEVELRREGPRASVCVCNRGRLPQGFDLALGRGLGAGLALARSMLPGHDMTLTVREEGTQVVARFELECQVAPAAEAIELRIPAPA